LNKTHAFCASFRACLLQSWADGKKTTMNSTLFYKFLVVVLAVLLVLGGVYAGKTIHEMQIEVARSRNEEEKVESQVDDLKTKLDQDHEFLQLYETDPDFVERVARERLKNYAKPNEFVYRFDPDPLTSAPVGNLDSSPPPANAPFLGTSKPAAGTRHN
jgi:cell division protein FtsB